MSDNNNIKSFYQFFCEADGNAHIASEYAIRKTLDLINTFKPARILEIGLGIGSISGTVLGLYGNKAVEYYGTESNEFCLRELEKNLGREFKNLIVFPDLASLPPSIIYDLIIVDGKDHTLERVKELISPHGVIAIEGDRMPQQEILERLFPAFKLIHSISISKNHKDSPFSSHHWQGGLKIILVNPNSLQRLWWVKEKLFNKLKYIYRSVRRKG